MQRVEVLGTVVWTVRKGIGASTRMFALVRKFRVNAVYLGFFLYLATVIVNIH